MSPFRFFLALWILVLAPALLAIDVAAQNASPPARPAAHAAALVGAVWVNANDSQYRDRIKVDELISNLAELPFNTVILQVRASGDAYYQSELAPKSFGIPESFDPLKTIVDQLHKGQRHQRVVAWFDPYMVGNENRPTPVPLTHVAQAHPEWLSRRADGKRTDGQGNIYLEPALPAVQSHLESVIRELAGRYELDGICFDPMSYPCSDGQWGYLPEVLQQWQQTSGKQGTPAPGNKEWIRFRAGVIQRSLQGFAEAARSARPAIVVSAAAETRAAAPPSAGEFIESAVMSQCLQDWPQWMADRVIDQVILKNFWPETSGADTFDAWLGLALESSRASGVPLVVGVAGTENESINALAQLRRAADSGVAGVALSNYAMPISDSGAISLFFDAFDKTIMARSRRSSPGVLSQLATTTAPLRRLSTTEAKVAPATPPSANPSEPPVGGVPDSESFDMPPPPQVEEGHGGQILPAQGPATEPTSNTQDVSEQELRILSGMEKKPAVQSDQPTTQTAGGELTRQQMLAELLNDKRFTEAQDFTFIRPSERAREYLRQTYNNIFD